MKKFIEELKRRNVIKAAISYVVFSWILIQVASILYPSFGWGQDAISKTLILLIIGFPVWIVFAYLFEWTPSGFQKTNDVAEETSIAKSTSKKMNGIIMAGLSFAVLLLVADRVFDFTGANDATNMDKSIAVLAFADMSPEKDQEYFSDGISEEILNLLAKIPELKVISRTSAFSFKGTNTTTEEIGAKLKVAHVLEGSIRKSGNTFRITTQLINVADGTHLWSETYDRDMGDIFKIQDEIAAKVTQQLRVTILGDVVATKETDTEAYNLFLQTKQLSLQITSDSNENAEKLIRQSIAIDSTYAPAWALLSNVIYESIFNYTRGRGTRTERITIGKAAVNKAIQLDPKNALAYASLADYNRLEWDFEAAARNTNKALELAPENSEIMRRTASSKLNLGNLEEGIAIYKKAITLDPLNYIPDFNLALLYSWNDQYDEAEASMQKYLLMYPNTGVAHNFMGAILLAKGNYQQALVEVEKDNDPFWNLYRKSMVVYALGRQDEANTLLKQLVDEFGNESWPNIAHVYAYRGEKDEAFKWLELAFDNRDSSLLEILNYPELKSLYGDPRWNAFINKLGLPKDHGFHLD